MYSPSQIGTVLKCLWDSVRCLCRLVTGWIPPFSDGIINNSQDSQVISSQAWYIVFDHITYHHSTRALQSSGGAWIWVHISCVQVAGLQPLDYCCHTHYYINILTLCGRPMSGGFPLAHWFPWCWPVRLLRTPPRQTALSESQSAVASWMWMHLFWSKK